MKILYIRPYAGEIDIISAGLPDTKFVMAQSVEEVPEEVRAGITVLSVFVDYEVTADVLNLLPNLQLIATRSAGYDHIDLKTAANLGVRVCCVPHYGTRTVAEYAIALLFSLSRNVARSNIDMRQDPALSNLQEYEGFDLFGKTLGIVGTGAIGRNVCALGRALGMKVVAFDVVADDIWAADCGVSYETLDEVLREADVVSLHIPSLPQTRHLIDAQKISLMKSGAMLINTARGEVVDTIALVEALRSGHIAGAGLDVLEAEHELRAATSAQSENMELSAILAANHELIAMPNVVVTPHVGFNTAEAKREITDITLANIQAFATGTIQNEVKV